MADREVLKQWVALLEFKADEAKARDLILNARGVGTALLGIVAAIEAASLAMREMVFKQSERVEQQSFVAERAGATVKELHALGFAAEQTGSSFEEAQAGLDSFTQHWRNQQLQNSVANTMRNAGMAQADIDALFATGDKLKIMMATIDAINKEKNEARQDALRELYGIPRNLGRYHAEEFKKWFEKSQQRWDAAGINNEKLTQNSRHLQEAWKNLSDAVGAVILKVTEKLSPYITEQLEKLMKFLEENSKEIGEWIDYAITSTFEFAKLLGGMFKTAVKDLNDWFKSHLNMSLGEAGDKLAHMVGLTNAWQLALATLLGFIVLRWIPGIRFALTGLMGHPVIAALIAAAGIVGSLSPGAMEEGRIDPNTGLPTTEPVPGMTAPGEIPKGKEGNPDDVMGKAWKKGKELIERGKKKIFGDSGETPTDGAGKPVAPITGGDRPKLAGLDRGLVADLLKAEKETGISFRVTSGTRTPEEAAANAAAGIGVRHSKHLLGRAADLHLSVGGKETTDRAVYDRFAKSFIEAGKTEGRTGNRWLGHLPGRWGRDIWHFDQGLGARTPSTDRYTGPEKIKEKVKDEVHGALKATNGRLFAGMDADAIRRKLEHKGPAAPFNETSNRYSFGQNVAINIHGGDRGLGTKPTDMDGPTPNARLLANLKGAVA